MIAEIAAGAQAISSIASMFGGGGGLSPRMQMAYQDEYQRRLLRDQLQLRVADARDAGLHPLAAIGISPVSSNVQAVGDTGFSAADRIAEAGNGIARAAQAFDTDTQRLSNRLLESQIQGQEIENAYRASQLARLSDPTQNPPGLPSNSLLHRQGDAGVMQPPPAPATAQFINRDGTMTHYPSEPAKESIEDSLIYEAEHYLRNRILPFFNGAADNYVRGRDYIRDRAARRQRQRY